MISFDGIEQKLYRSKEHICNLEVEIDRFFQESKYPILCDQNTEILPEAIEYHRNRPIPLRFSLLAGEIIHHLRSILDHIVWQFSEPTYREANRKWIEFPILQTRPAQKDVFTSYERKIKGIAKPVVCALIEQLQPYNCVGGHVDSLPLIIHNLDVIDKHRELMIVIGTPAIQLPMEVMQRALRYQCGITGSTPVDFKKEFESHGKIVPQVAFDEFGSAKAEPVVQALNQLQNFMVWVVAEFDKLR